MPTDDQLLEMRYQLTQFFAKPALVDAYCDVERVTRDLEPEERLFALAFATAIQLQAMRSPYLAGCITAYLRSTFNPPLNDAMQATLCKLLGIALVPPPPRHPIDDEVRDAG